MAPPTSPAIRLPSFAPRAPSLLTFSDPPPETAKKLLQRPGFLAGLVAALVILALVIVLWPSAGRLVVAVAGPNGTVVDGIEISVDGKVVCTSSPCQVSDLEAKSYLVAVTAEGFERTAPQAVIVKSGEDAVHNVTLQAPLVVAPTGLDIPASTPGLELTIDGRVHGTLPQRVLDLTPGDHVLKVSGGERYRDEEKTVTVVEGQVLSLQPFALEVKRGRAIIDGGANIEDAVVKLNGRTIKLPHTVDLDTSQKHALTATREGFENFEQLLTFEPGKAERTFTVSLTPSEASGDEAEASHEDERASSASRRSSSARKSTASRSARSASGSSSSAGKGTLNITSTPSAMVILDGRPIGKTPRMGVKVSPGAHSIVFVSDKGRKRATTKVAAGDSKTVSVRF